MRPPQVGILGFGAVRVQPVVDGDAVVAAPALPISLSADHRVVDGHAATSFLDAVAAQLARFGADQEQRGALTYRFAVTTYQARAARDRHLGKAGPPGSVDAPTAGAPVAEWHDTTEEYLEAILEIEEEGIVPIRARLVERLGLSAPAVSETVNRLVDHGYAELLDDRSLRLTDKGRSVATSIVRRHRLAERLLVDVIGLEWEKVHKEADRWEHAISADVEEKLVLLLGDPATCPHGNPIPGSTPQGRGSGVHAAHPDAARARSWCAASARRSRSTRTRSRSSPAPS